MIAPECPICTFRIRGSNHTGYRCVQCHARYSPQFVRRLRRAHVRELIDANFGVRRVTEIEQEHFVIPISEPSDFKSDSSSMMPEGVEEESAFVDLADLIARELRGETEMPELRESAADMLTLDDERPGMLDEEYALEMPMSKNSRKAVVRTRSRATKRTVKSKKSSRKKSIVKKSSTRRRR